MTRKRNSRATILINLTSALFLGSIEKRSSVAMFAGSLAGRFDIACALKKWGGPKSLAAKLKFKEAKHRKVT
jgi:hypothetical protein